VLPVTTFQTAQDVETYPEAGQARWAMMDGMMSGNDVGNGADLAAGRRRPDPLGGRARQVPVLGT
jgi:hypothetical protein